MGYSFTIGNGVMVKHSDMFSRWEVEDVELASAPRFDDDEMTGRSNSRSPSYSGWESFCRAAGSSVFNLFYRTPDGHTGEGTLIPEHPGAAKIEQKHVDVIAAALEACKKRGTVAGFREGQDSTLARLMWLHFWFNWAVENCENPMIQNT